MRQPARSRAMPTRRSSAALLIVALLLLAGAVGVQLAFGTQEQVTEWSMDDLRPLADSPSDDTALNLGPADRSEVVDAARDESELLLEASNAPTRILRGRVVDVGGAPVAGAVVRLTLRVAGRSVNRGEAVNRPIKTGGDGVFAFRGPLGGIRSVMVSASHPDHADAAVEREIVGGGQGEIVLGDVILTPGGVVTGTVVSIDGVGIVDASVELSPNSGPGRGVMTRGHDVHTLGGGSFRFERVPAGAYRIVARAPRMLVATSENFGVREGSVTTVPPLAVGPGCALDGLVTDRQGRPVAGARVWVNPDKPGPTGTGETGTDGRFTIDHLARDKGALRVQKEGYVTHQGRVDLTTSERATVILEDGLRITGTVRDAGSGAPLTKFAVQARRLRALANRSADLGALETEPQARIRDLDADARAQLEAAIARTHETRRGTALDQWREQVRNLPKAPGPPSAHPDGTFVCDGLDEGVWVIDVSAPDHQLARSEAIELAVGRPAAPVDFALAGGHTVAGMVLGPDGAAIAGALVELMLMPPPGAPASARTRGVSVLRTTSSATGEFALRNAPAGLVSVAATAKGHDAGQSAPFDLGADVADVAIQLGARARIVGRVVGAPEGEGGDVSVVAIANFRNVTSRAADADGRFALDDLKPGPYHVRAYLCDGREATRRALASLRGDGRDTPPDLVLEAGETRAFDVAVQRIPVGRVTGHVRRNGVPAHNYAVRLTRHESQAPNLDPVSMEMVDFGGASLPSRAIEADGSFAIPDVEAGEYWLRVQAPGRDASELHRERIVVVAEQTTNVEIAATCGGIDGEVVAPESDGPPLQGTLRLFREAASVPSDIEAWEADGRLRHVRFRAGRFRAEDIAVGSYLVEIRAGKDRLNATARVDIAPGVVTTARLTAGAKTEVAPKRR